MKITDGRRQLNGIESMLRETLLDAEDSLSAFRLTATNGMHPEIERLILQLKFTADSVLEQPTKQR